MAQDGENQEGWREKKRRETLGRITESALELFVANGYEATTLDAIAEASGISRRTFFHYFDTKEDILAAWQAGLPEAFRRAILAEVAGRSPFEVVSRAHLQLVAHLDADQALIIDQILRSNDQLRASNQSKYLLMEQAAFEALSELWPEPSRREGLRVVAMASIGALRLAIDGWAQERGRTPLVGHLRRAFASLQDELSAN